jgi:hypothetical protein
MSNNPSMQDGIVHNVSPLVVLFNSGNICAFLRLNKTGFAHE